MDKVVKMAAPMGIVALLVWWAVIATRPPVAPPPPSVAPRAAIPDVINGVAENYVECAAYYALTARFLIADGDPEIGNQYDERANAAFEQARELTGQDTLALMRRRDTIMNTMNDSASQAGHGLADLGVVYDEECIKLLDG